MNLTGSAIVLTFLTAACSPMRPSDFAAGTPSFDPLRFFTGETTSNGVRENRRGQPVAQVFTATSGKMTGDILHLEQDLRFISGAKITTSHRSWQLRKTGSHTYQGTANDIIGTATGEAHGNAFHWSFPLALSPGNPLTTIRMSQWMYLQPGGETMLNHTTISKAGIVVSQVTETFAKKKPAKNSTNPTP
ncbi:MAG: hypothetical protein RLZZ214_404 [Verrucomicrobiota bacterium]|jgi:hypothetical protein